jgi:hypothetical protein
MKPRILSVFAQFLLTAVSLSNAGIAADATRTLEKNSYYFKPLSTVFGTINSSGWYRSASVDKNFGFYIGLPLSITYISEKDRSYDSTYIDEPCQQCIEQNRNSRGCLPSRTITLPTIFGRDKAPVINIVSVLDQNNDVLGFTHKYFSDGVEELSQLNWMPYAALQLGVSWFYTSLQLRFIAIPTDIFTITLPAFALQHDLKSVFPNLPFHLSLAGNATFININWKPGDDVKGTVKFNGVSNFLGVLAGYRFGVLETFLQTGWEHSILKTSGTVTVLPDEVIKPSVKLIGRNAFRIGLNIAMDVGYTAVVGHSFGSEMNTTVNLLGYSYKKK